MKPPQTANMNPSGKIRMEWLPQPETPAMHPHRPGQTDIRKRSEREEIPA